MKAHTPAPAEIAARAYEIYLERGATEGHDLEDWLEAHAINELVVAGVATNNSVEATVRMAGNLGFDVVVVEDATATFERTGPDGVRYSADQMHRIALASLHDEFARVQSASDVLASLPQ